ncbi:MULTISPECIES: hypothetical protein [Arthrobacter]|jgi:hypothetical protein|uniref:hypothetical protein n=1 Tax=Arthrobacter TaxID=1663 RepID=UPI001116E86B|nr:MULTISPECIES: hypothetical protein [Arthrobacter]MDQ0209680.1 hypothetical protein [Arthrobacter bambusae]MDQ0233994.1 hypothetical protein [Arthrobacter bambusae]
MNEERAPRRHGREEEGKARDKAGKTIPSESPGSKVDPDFIPDESPENPNEERARETPEETGS